jgi:hypothetical protein
LKSLGFIGNGGFSLSLGHFPRHPSRMDILSYSHTARLGWSVCFGDAGSAISISSSVVAANHSDAFPDLGPAARGRLNDWLNGLAYMLNAKLSGSA